MVGKKKTFSEADSLACEFVGRYFTHKQSGGKYLLTGHVLLEKELDILAVYVDTNGITWARPKEEFYARFELTDDSF